MDNNIELPYEENDGTKSKISEGITEKNVRISFSAKKSSRKISKAVLFTIDNNENFILAVGYQKKKSNSRQME